MSSVYRLTPSPHSASSEPWLSGTIAVAGGYRTTLDYPIAYRLVMTGECLNLQIREAVTVPLTLYEGCDVEALWVLFKTARGDEFARVRIEE